MALDNNIKDQGILSTPTFKVHLNAGMSKRIVDYIESTYPVTQVFWESVGDYGTLTVTGMNFIQKEKFLARLSDMYPYEVENNPATQ
jgi:hypothetical protein